MNNINSLKFIEQPSTEEVNFYVTASSDNTFRIWYTFFLEDKPN